MLLAAGGWLAWGLGAQLSALDPPPEPVAAEVVIAAVDYSAKGMLSGQLVARPAVLWNDASGTVTAVRVAVGDILKVGSPVADVDSRTVRAYHAETALYRTLDRGAKGLDVEVAQELLNVVLPDLDLPSTGVFGSATEAAVKAYERELGVASPTGVFDPSWFVLLPAAEFRIGAVQLRVGQPSPGPGTAFLDGAQELRDLTLITDSAGPDGGYTFSYQGAVHSVSRTGDEWVLDEEAALADLLAAQSKSAEGDLVQVEGRVALADPAQGQAVPPAALVLDPDGVSCVLMADDLRAVEVEPLGSAIDGAALVRSELPDGANVLVNPREMVPDARCR